MDANNQKNRAAYSAILVFKVCELQFQIELVCRFYFNNLLTNGLVLAKLIFNNIHNFLLPFLVLKQQIFFEIE